MLHAAFFLVGVLFFAGLILGIGYFLIALLISIFRSIDIFFNGTYEDAKRKQAEWEKEMNLEETRRERDFRLRMKEFEEREKRKP